MMKKQLKWWKWSGSVVAQETRKVGASSAQEAFVGTVI